MAHPWISLPLSSVVVRMLGKIRISGFGLRQAEVQTRDCRHVSCEACCLVRVIVGKSDSHHEAESPFHAITKLPRILDASTVLMMGINNSVNENPSPRFYTESFARTPGWSSHGEDAENNCRVQQYSLCSCGCAECCFVSEVIDTHFSMRQFWCLDP